VNKNPEQPIEAAEATPWMPSFQYDKLLAQGAVFEQKSSTGMEEAKLHFQIQRQIWKYGKHSYQKAGAAKKGRFPPEPEGILAKDGALNVYFRYYGRSHTHLSIAKDAPEARAVQPPELGPVVELAEVGGLHRRYKRRAD
jgi:hypothetical protein